MTQTQVSELYVSIFNRASESTGNKKWMAEENAADAADLMLADAEAIAQFGTSLDSNEAFVAHLYATILGKGDGVDAAGKAGWVAYLEQGNSKGSMIAEMISVIPNYYEGGSAFADADQVTKDAALFYKNKVAVSDYAVSKVGELEADEIAALVFGTNGLVVDATAASITTAKIAVDAVATANPITVTPGTNIINIGGTTIEGTTADDMFISRAGDIDDSTIINGNGGNDTLKLLLDNGENNGETAITPITNGIDTLEVRVQSTTTVSGDNNIDTQNPTNTESNIDAQDMNGTTEFWDVDSRANLVVEDVRNNSADTLVGMKQTDVDVDYALLFNAHNITDKGTTTSGAQLTIDLINVQTLTDSNEPLADNPYLGFEFTLTDKAGTSKTYSVTPDKFQEAKTYTELAKTINDYIQGELGLTNVSATTGITTNVFNSVTGVNVGTKTEILISTNDSSTLGTGSWLIKGKLPEDNNLQANMGDKGPGETGTLTQTKIVLDDVGQGSQGGDLKVGSMSNAFIWTHSGSKGIQEFNVEVDRSSWLTSLTSSLTGATLANSYDTLEVVNFKNIGANEDVRIDALVDVRTVNASAMTGEVNITADLTDDSVIKYLHPIEEDNKGESADNITFTYTLGSNNDTFNLTVDDALVADSDFAVSIAGGAGDDTITTNLDAMSASEYASHKSLKNLRVDGGEGSDTITTAGDGDWIINGGAGNDTIYADNTGAGVTTTVTTAATAATGAYATGGAAAVQTMTFGAANASILSGGTGLITVAGVAVNVGEGWTATQVGDAVVAAFAANTTYATVVNTAGAVAFTWATNARVDTLNTFVDTGTTGVSVTGTNVATTMGIADGGAVSEVQTIAITSLAPGATTAGATTFVVDGVNVVVNVALTDTAATVAANVAAALNANASVAKAFVATDTTVVNATDTDATYTAATALAATVVVEFNGTGNHAAISNTTTAVGSTVAAATDNVEAAALANGTAAVQDLVVTAGVGHATNATTITVAGVTVTIPDTTTTAISVTSVGDAIVDAFAGNATFATVVNVAGTVTFTYADAGVQDLIQVLDVDAGVTSTISTTTAGVNATGTKAVAASTVQTVNTVQVITSDIEGYNTTAAVAADDAVWTANNLAADNQINTLDTVATSSFTGIKGQVQVAFKGLSSLVIDLDYSTTTKSSTSYDIRKALKIAVNDDAVLSKLLVVKDGPEGTFIVESLIDGVMNLTDLSINFTAPLAAGATAVAGKLQLAAGEVAFPAAAANTAYTLAFAQSDGGVDLNGSNSIAANGSDNTIDAGTGNDVIVLGTSSTTTQSNASADSSDTVVFTGSFGNDTIVNFVTGSSAASDTLDFTALLKKGTATTYDNAGSLTLSNSEIVLNTDSSVNTYVTAANTAVNGLILVTSATDANVASVYSAVSTTAATTVATTLIGQIDLADVTIASLTINDFA